MAEITSSRCPLSCEILVAGNEPTMTLCLSTSRGNNQRSVTPVKELYNTLVCCQPTSF